MYFQYFLLGRPAGYFFRIDLIVDVYTIHVEVVGFDRFWLWDSEFLATDLTLTGDQVTWTRKVCVGNHDDVVVVPRRNRDSFLLEGNAVSSVRQVSSQGTLWDLQG